MEFDLTIDQYRLDEEWRNQPKLYHEQARAAADARWELDMAKNRLEVVTADLYHAATERPEQFGLQKTTEAAIKNAITVHKAYQAAHQEVLQWKHDLAMLDAAVSALEHRKKALEKLVELHLADYYSEPKAKGASQEQMNEARKIAVRRGKQK